MAGSSASPSLLYHPEWRPPMSTQKSSARKSSKTSRSLGFAVERRDGKVFVNGYPLPAVEGPRAVGRARMRKAVREALKK